MKLPWVSRKKYDAAVKGAEIMRMRLQVAEARIKELGGLDVPQAKKEEKAPVPRARRFSSIRSDFQRSTWKEAHKVKDDSTAG